MILGGWVRNWFENAEIFTEDKNGTKRILELDIKGPYFARVYKDEVTEYNRFSIQMGSSFDLKVPDEGQLEAAFKKDLNILEILQLKADEGSIESADVANILIRQKKDQGYSEERYEDMLKILRVWIENEDMEMLEEFKSFMQSSESLDDLTYDNYKQGAIQKAAPKVIGRTEEF